MVFQDEVLRGFAGVFDGESAVKCFFAPGRVNLIGEHIDYLGGRVLPAAVSLGITAAVRYREDRLFRFRSREESSPVDFDLCTALEPSSGWGKFPRGVVAGLTDEERTFPGCDVYFASDLPEGSGLSSSAALEVLTAFLLLHPPEGDAPDRVWLAKFCRKVENDYVGVNCGIMDQFAVALGKKARAILLDTATLDYEYVPADFGSYELVIMNTNKKRELSGSKYNERRAECDTALARLNRARPSSESLRHLVDAGDAEIAALEDETLRRRARHAAAENRRVDKSVRALANGDIPAFGRLLDESHRSLREDFDVTGPHLDALVDAARNCPACIGARMTGAGFGGCAIALVKQDAVGSFEQSVGVKYKAAVGLEASFYSTKIVDGVGVI